MLDKYRHEIDNLDEEIIKLLTKRFDLSIKVGNYKKEKNINVENKNRETEIINNIKLKENYSNNISEIYETIFIESKKVQK